MKNLLNLGIPLSKKEQLSIMGGGPGDPDPICPEGEFACRCDVDDFSCVCTPQECYDQCGL